MSLGQDRSYMKTTIVKLRLIDSVGIEDTEDDTLHAVTAGGDDYTLNKVSGATVTVGDYIITKGNVGWATETTPNTHLTAALYASEGWRYVRGGRN